MLHHGKHPAVVVCSQSRIYCSTCNTVKCDITSSSCFCFIPFCDCLLNSNLVLVVHLKAALTNESFYHCIHPEKKGIKFTHCCKKRRMRALISSEPKQLPCIGNGQTFVRCIKDKNRGQGSINLNYHLRVYNVWCKHQRLRQCQFE